MPDSFPAKRDASPIYAEVVPRELTEELQHVVDQDFTPFLEAAGDLCITRLLENFPEFFRENSGHSVEWIGYKEAGAQLVLRAFLQRVIHDGGRITREYPLRRRTDLLIEWPRGGRWDPGKVSKHVTEC